MIDDNRDHWVNIALSSIYKCYSRKKTDFDKGVLWANQTIKSKDVEIKNLKERIGVIYNMTNINEFSASGESLESSIWKREVDYANSHINDENVFSQSYLKMIILADNEIKRLKALNKDLEEKNKTKNESK